VTEQVVVPEIVEEPVVKIEAPVEEKKSYRTETEIALEGRKKGLTIVGRVDLKQRRDRVEPKEGTVPQKPAVPLTPAQEEAEKNKKKKIIFR
jgi:hypothetical protein